MKFKYQKKCELCGKSISFSKASDFRKTSLCEACFKKNEIEKKKEQEELELKRTPKPELGYSFELMKIDRHNISKFIFPENRRRLSSDQLSSLRKAILNNLHFDSPIVVNQVDGMFRLIDGNHRIEVIKEVIKKYSRFQIDVLTIIYKEQDPDNEIMLFRRWNTGKLQSLDDFLQSVSNKIDFIKWLRNDFPLRITIYNQPDSINVRRICSAYLAAKHNLDSGYGLHRSKFGEDIKELDEDDFKKLKEIAQFLRNIFGELGPKNHYYQQHILSPIIFLIYDRSLTDNLSDKIRDQIVGDEELLKFAKFGGKAAHKEMIARMQEKLKLKPVLRLE